MHLALLYHLTSPAFSFPLCAVTRVMELSECVMSAQNILIIGIYAAHVHYHHYCIVLLHSVLLFRHLMILGL